MTKKPEELIKELARKTSNKYCFDCGRTGVHNNVCLTFGTFVCTTCAGLHRAFSHSAKSINLTSFSQKEVETMQNGGNKRAERVWHAGLPERPHGMDLNDVKNVEKFMRMVYIDKRWYNPQGALEKDKKKVTSTAPPAPRKVESPALPTPTALPVTHVPTSASSVPPPAQPGTSPLTPAGTTSVPAQPEQQDAKRTASQFDLLSNLGELMETPAPPMSPSAIFDRPVASSAQNSTALPAPPAREDDFSAVTPELVTYLTNALRGVMNMYSLSTKQLHHAVEQAVISIVGPSATVSIRKEERKVAPESVPPTPPNTNTLLSHKPSPTPHTSYGISPGMGTLNLSTLKSTLPPGSQHGSSADFDDPLAGIGASDGGSGNPFDDDFTADRSSFSGACESTGSTTSSYDGGKRGSISAPTPPASHNPHMSGTMSFGGHTQGPGGSLVTPPPSVSGMPAGQFLPMPGHMRPLVTPPSSVAGNSPGTFSGGTGATASMAGNPFGGGVAAPASVPGGYMMMPAGMIQPAMYQFQPAPAPGYAAAAYSQTGSTPYGIPHPSFPVGTVAAAFPAMQQLQQQQQQTGAATDASQQQQPAAAKKQSNDHLFVGLNPLS